MRIRQAFFVLTIILILVSCKGKKASLSGEDPVAFGDFTESFSVVKPPYQFTDTLLTRKEKDAAMISNKVFAQFVPDSVLRLLTGKGAKPKIYPVARMEAGNEQYLLAKLVLPAKKQVAVLCFGKKDQFLGLMPLMQLDGAVATRQLAGIDRGYTFFKSVQRRNADGTESEGKDAYLFNSDSKKFMLIMQEQLDENAVEVINPIDTLPRKNRFSADYGTDKKNIVSVRDHAKDPKKFIFFIHISKKGNACDGELKGEAVFTAPGTAIYQQPGDPCILQFSFSGSAVVLKEQEGCGSRRDIDCSFDGSYGKRKSPVVKKPSSKASGK